MESTAWRRNVFAVTAASFMGYTGFTLVMPFLPLFIAQLGISDVGEIAMWTGLSLGVTPALTALLAPAWGRLGDRFGRKIMVERSRDHQLLAVALGDARPDRRHHGGDGGRHAEADARPQRDLARIVHAELVDVERQERHDQREAGEADEACGGDSEQVSSPVRN